MKSLKILLMCLLLSLGLEACVSSKPPPRPLDLPFSRIYVATYDQVWNATVNVLETYTIIEASRESGVLKTDFATEWYSTALYSDPDKANRLDQVRNKLSVKLSKGLVSQTGKSAVRVQIVKRLEKYGNLVTDWQPFATDQAEEAVILYRIGQRLRIAKAIARERAKKSSN